MKKSIWTAPLLGLTLVGLVAPAAVNAASANDMISNGEVTFKADNSSTGPKDPLDPTDPNPIKPIDPSNPGGNPTPGTSGPLSLDFASSFTFGEAAISSDDAKYYAKPQVFTQQDGTTVDRPNYVQVSDKRGTFEGWTLKVKQDKQFAVKDDATRELIGAQLKFKNASLVSATDSKYAPTGLASFELIPGTAQIAPVEAVKDQGMGTWIYRFGDDKQMGRSVELSVPGKTPKMAKAYVTALTWTLESTPANVTPKP
ncbi:WxL domain-containing protein [Lacticaseibacillus casei]|jgi:hypothetical protein|uniref:WxL domain-containing protein n=1 Tax=Lacticaseibacillus huelsenbergensis TaxID=3035291 RepID=A0ABY8DTX1_9LACO|nr:MULTISPECIES: WxL domain-containing protein [Lacticaseibacillus]MDE3281279.1 WxL domain-containing protein [Lacticaseibacillus casei]MDG3062177.1 WxL domain-containing protein [Lacticaseibacillus sp. BCRC 81376]QVI36285.1 WxL domain-containing protein [Lacticaseibacillus casei]QXG58084.1 WxL domain-containing protein [Lacticaseibacillus casei]WFB40444.1 WxL domain-containing protein [Lacticaseibacillus huelsenbergensis]